MHTGRAAAAQLLHARIWLKADVREDGRRWSAAALAAALDTSESTVHRVRQAFVAWGLETAVSRKPPSGRQYRKLDGPQEAPWLAVTCRAPPEGRRRWTLKLWAAKLDRSGHRRPQQSGVCPYPATQNALKPWRHKPWVIPPHANAEFVCAMADVLEVDTRPDDPQRPQGCIAETSTPLVAETRALLPASPGQPERVDDAYERQGPATLCLVCEPWAGQRRVKVTARRTAVDLALLLQAVVAVH